MNSEINARVKVAFVGAGYMAREHIRAFVGLPRVELSGIFSRTHDRARVLASEFGIPEVCSSVEELFERTHADLVVVTVTELSMNDVSRRCFVHSWTVLLEKPAGFDLADAEAILQRAREAGAMQRIFVALNRRAYHSTRRAVALLEAEPGPRFISVQDQQDQEDARAGGQPDLVVRNWMFANSIHTIDYLRVFGRGKVTNVCNVVPWDPARPGIVVAQLVYSSGDIGLYQGIWNGPGPWAVAVTTSALRVEMRPLELLTIQHRGDRRAIPSEPDPVDTEFKPGLRWQAEQVLGAARGAATVLPTLDDAIESTRLCARIFGM